MLKIAIVTNIIPPYREGFYDIILNNQTYEIDVYCQTKIPGSNIISSHIKYKSKVFITKYYAPFNNEKIVIQFLPFFKLLFKYNIIIVDGNLRHLSQAVYSTFFRLFNKKVVIWSNVYTFGGNKLLQKIRMVWWKYFNYFLMYTIFDVHELVNAGFRNKRILNINNGINQNEIENQIARWNQNKLHDFKIKHNIDSNNIIISSGRVNRVNNHIIVLNALSILKLRIPDILWVIIGSGDEIDKLSLHIEKFNLINNVKLIGEVYDESIKCPWFLISKIFIHPGPIGLSLLNAYGYSLPVITHNNLSYHGPEISMFKDKETGLYFEFNNIEDLSQQIESILIDDNIQNRLSLNVYDIASKKNNTDIMAQQFFKFIDSIS